MSQNLTDRPYWLDLLARVDQLVAEGATDVEIGFQIKAEFGLRRQLSTAERFPAIGRRKTRPFWV